MTKCGDGFEKGIYDDEMHLMMVTAFDDGDLLLQS